MSSQSTKKEKGIGTLSLALGLLPTMLTASLDGVSLLTMAMDAMKLTFSPYMVAFGLILAVPGFFLGFTHNKDWGAKFGAFLCAIGSIYIVVQLITAFLQ
jgi:uncharacterized membrane protein